MPIVNTERWESERTRIGPDRIVDPDRAMAYYIASAIMDWLDANAGPIEMRPLLERAVRDGLDAMPQGLNRVAQCNGDTVPATPLVGAADLVWCSHRRGQEFVDAWNRYFSSAHDLERMRDAEDGVAVLIAPQGGWRLVPRPNWSYGPRNPLRWDYPQAHNEEDEASCPTTSESAAACT